MTTNLEEALGNSGDKIYFDAQVTGRRPDAIRRAVAAGKHIYCEKPVSTDTASALELFRLCERAGLKHGVVQDKLWLPGIIKLRRLIQQGFFGRILSVRGEFGYWVFEGDSIPHSDRPGITGKKTMEGSLVICFVTGDMYWIMFLEK
jgi:predicted dehydrogenase